MGRALPRLEAAGCVGSFHRTVEPVVVARLVHNLVDGENAPRAVLLAAAIAI
jgi:hypothetical protein